MNVTRILPDKIGFGTAPLGNMFRAIPEGEAAATVQAAWDQGIRYYDTAPLYGAGPPLTTGVRRGGHRRAHTAGARPASWWSVVVRVRRSAGPRRVSPRVPSGGRPRRRGRSR